MVQPNTEQSINRQQKQNKPPQTKMNLKDKVFKMNIKDDFK